MGGRMIVGLVAVTAILALLAAIAGRIHEAGRDSLRIEIEDDNKGAADEADNADLGYNDCIDAGRVYDFGAGKCLGSL